MVTASLVECFCCPYHLLLRWMRQNSSFRRLHVIYFMVFTILGFLSLSTSPRPSHMPSLTLIDALYNTVSAITVTGFSSVAIHQYSLNDQVTLLILMVLGGQVFTSVIPLLIRIMHWKYPAPTVEAKQVKEMVKKDYEGKQVRRVMSMPALKSNAWEGVNGYSHGLGRFKVEALEEAGLEGKKERERIEREAIEMLSKIVPMYFVVVQAIGFIVCEIYVMSSPYATRVLKTNGVDRSFFCLFSSVSSFANAGFILLDENLMPLQRASILLICLSILILLGNTMFAPTLRLLIWILYHTAPHRKEVYRYLLRCPRRCYTHLFPRHETWWLVSTVAVFNATQIISMCALDWFGPAFEGLGSGYKLVDSFFQSITTRNAGMNVINLTALASSTLFFCTGMMYIAVYPVYVTRERSKEPIKMGDGSMSNPEQEMYKQFRKLVARDSVYVFLATFFICVSERNSMRHDPSNFSVFNILFEVVSAYGNVGLSLGYSCSLRPPSLTNGCIDVTYSFSGKWSVTGKLLLIVVMMLGRHRGLPDDEDWAIAPQKNQ